MKNTGPPNAEYVIPSMRHELGRGRRRLAKELSFQRMKDPSNENQTNRYFRIDRGVNKISDRQYSLSELLGSGIMSRI